MRPTNKDNKPPAALKGKKTDEHLTSANGYSNHLKTSGLPTIKEMARPSVQFFNLVKN